MASIYQRPGSIFWWIKYRNPIGKIIRHSTKFRVGVGTETRSARELCAKRTMEELQTKSQHFKGWDWVPDFINTKYNAPHITAHRYTGIWKNLIMYLDEMQIPGPAQLTRSHCMDYIAWRARPNKSIGKYRACTATAQMELKILSMVMSEAIKRDYATVNPAKALGLKKPKPREKPELTDEDLALIRQQIDREDEPLKTFFKNSFEIALHQGCRLSETYLNPQTAVLIADDQSKGTIQFRIKGDRQHTTALHPNLIPLFSNLKSKGATATYIKPPQPSKEWRWLFRRAGLHTIRPGVCFHCLRVTAVTRIARAGVTESKAMKYIGHASTTVHRAYQRLQLQDLGDCLSAVQPVDKSSQS